MKKLILFRLCSHFSSGKDFSTYHYFTDVKEAYSYALNLLDEFPSYDSIDIFLALSFSDLSTIGFVGNVSL